MHVNAVCHRRKESALAMTITSVYVLLPHNLETENVKYGRNGKVKCDTNNFFIMDKRIMANKC